MWNLIKFWGYNSFYYLNFLTKYHSIKKNNDTEQLLEVIDNYVKNSLKNLKIDIIVKNEENKPEENALYIGNHESIFDSLFSYEAINHDHVTYFAAGDKRDMNDYPVVRNIVKMVGIIFVDRKSLKSGVLSIKKGVKTLNEGKDLVIFPEGEVNEHLEKNGRMVADFKAGPFRCAIEAKKPIVPMVIHGGGKIHNSLSVNSRINSGTVEVEFLKPYTKHLTEKISAVDVALEVEEMINLSLKKEKYEKSYLCN